MEHSIFTLGDDDRMEFDGECLCVMDPYPFRWTHRKMIRIHKQRIGAILMLTQHWPAGDDMPPDETIEHKALYIQKNGLWFFLRVPERHINGAALWLSGVLGVPIHSATGELSDVRLEPDWIAIQPQGTQGHDTL